MTRRARSGRGKLSRDEARRLLEPYEVPSVIPSLTRTTTPFAEQRCDHCGGIHARNCPAVAEIQYYADGRVKRVAFWPRSMWSDDGVIWLDEIMEAADLDE